MSMHESGSETRHTPESEELLSIGTNNVEEARTSLAQNPPEEILTEIFLHTISNGFEDSRAMAETSSEWRAFFSTMSPINLLSINHSWRHTALNLHVLWSTWFIQLSNPSNGAFHMLNCILKQFIRLSGTYPLNPGLRFTGTFDAAAGCESVGPILECQERWTDAAVHMGHVPADVPQLVLDFARLSSLQRLKVFGTAWNCTDFDAGVFDSAIPSSPTAHELSSLRYAELTYLPISTSIPILSVAPNLTELVIRIHDDIEEFWERVPKEINLPFVRKLDLYRYSALHTDNPLFSLLRVLRFEVLEELTINSLALPQMLLLPFIVEPNRIGASLRSLCFSRDPEHDGEDEEFIHLLRLLPSLRSLAVHGAYSPLILLVLGDTEEDAYPTKCPWLEELTLEGAMGKAEQYKDLVSSRWNSPERCIHSMTFIDCKLSLLAAMSLDPKKLEHIEGVDEFIEEGLQLDIQSTRDVMHPEGTTLMRPVTIKLF